jgi:hypothetical protein
MLLSGKLYLQSATVLSHCCLELWPILIMQSKWSPVAPG